MANTDDNANLATGGNEGSDRVHRQPGRVRSNLAARIFLGLLLWFSFCKLPSTAADPSPQSWEPVLAYGFVHHLQWGKDIIFTYGPLGFLTADFYWGHGFGLILGWAFGFSLLLTWLLMSPLERLDLPLRILLCAGLPWLTVPQNLDLGVDPVYLFAITVIGLVLLSGRQNILWSVVLTLALCGFSLIKFTFCLYSVFVLLVVILAWAWQRNWKSAMIVFGSSGLMFPLLWWLAGQNACNLGCWFQHSLQVASGYSSAMVVAPSNYELVAGLLTGSCLLCLLLLLWLGSADWRTLTPQMVIVLAGIYLAWKEGFSRADIHVAVFFTYAFMLALFLPGLFGRPGKGRSFLLPLVAFIVVLVISSLALVPGLSLRGGTFLAVARTDMASRLVNTATAAFLPWQFKQNLETRLGSMQQAARLPEIATQVGTRPVGVLNCDQDVAILNGFNFRPHPIYQNYSAYTPALQRLNADFFDSPAAPDFVLWQYGVLDARFPTLEDGRILLTMLRNYTPVVGEGRYVLWKRNVQSKPVLRTPTSATTGSLGQWISVSADVNWLCVKMHETRYGTIRQLLYQGSIPSIEVRLVNGAIRRYDLPEGLAASGFVISPLLDSRICLGIPFLTHHEPARVVAVRVMADSRYFANVVDFELQSVKGVPLFQPAPASL